MVDVNTEARRREKLDGEDVDAWDVVLDPRDDLLRQRSLLFECRGHRFSSQKMGPQAHFNNAEMW
jgi:hypothetical protein